MTVQKTTLSLSILLALIVLLSSSLVIAESRFEEERIREVREERISGQYIVVFTEEVNADVAEEEIISRTRGERIGSYRSVFKGFAARLSPEAVLSLENDPRVDFLSEDRLVSIDDSTRGERERDVSATSRAERRKDTKDPKDPVVIEAKPAPVTASTQKLPTGVDRINAEGKANTGAGVHVAIIDTGILLDHPDLQANIVGGKNCSTGNSYNDGNGHGTHVAGTIAGINNGVGVVGVAPEAKLWSVRALDNNGGGSWSSVICGLDFVTSKGPKNGGPIKVANLSLGGGGSSDNNCGLSNNDALHKAICRTRDAGVTVVVAAGNSGANAANFVPAAYNDAVITVSALADYDGKVGGLGGSTSYGADDTFASFSNWGTPVDIGAPGVNIYSTWIGKGYKSISGTSMASPHAAGAAALYIATHPNALWSEVRSALIGAGEGIGSGHTDPSGKHPEKVLRTDTF